MDLNKLHDIMLEFQNFIGKYGLTKEDLRDIVRHLSEFVKTFEDVD